MLKTVLVLVLEFPSLRNVPVPRKWGSWSSCDRVSCVTTFPSLCLSPAPHLLNTVLKRDGIPSFSLDSLRSYASCYIIYVFLCLKLEMGLYSLEVVYFSARRCDFGVRLRPCIWLVCFYCWVISLSGGTTHCCWGIRHLSPCERGSCRSLAFSCFSSMHGAAVSQGWTPRARFLGGFDRHSYNLLDDARLPAKWMPLFAFCPVGMGSSGSASSSPWVLPHVQSLPQREDARRVLIHSDLWSRKSSIYPCYRVTLFQECFGYP